MAATRRQRSTTPGGDTRVAVTLRGEAEVLMEAEEVALRLPTPTPMAILKALAKKDPRLKDCLVRGNGNPRLSTKILINGYPPRSLSSRIPAGARVTVFAAKPCDG
jgi:hypothetical protein